MPTEDPSVWACFSRLALGPHDDEGEAQAFGGGDRATRRKRQSTQSSPRRTAAQSGGVVLDALAGGVDLGQVQLMDELLTLPEQDGREFARELLVKLAISDAGSLDTTTKARKCSPLRVAHGRQARFGSDHAPVLLQLRLGEDKCANSWARSSSSALPGER